jgi:histone H3/H4
MSRFDPLPRKPFKRLMREAMDVRFRRNALGGKR